MLLLPVLGRHGLGRGFCIWSRLPSPVYLTAVQPLPDAGVVRPVEGVPRLLEPAGDLGLDPGDGDASLLRA